jgi:hypothetical protein
MVFNPSATNIMSEMWSFVLGFIKFIYLYYPHFKSFCQMYLRHEWYKCKFDNNVPSLMHGFNMLLSEISRENLPQNT